VIRSWPVVLGCLFLISGGLNAQEAPPPSQSPPSLVRSILTDRGYPWYDPKNDAPRSLLPARSSWQKALQDRLDSWDRRLRSFWDRLALRPTPSGPDRPPTFLPSLILVVGAAALLALLWRLWKTHQSAPPDRQPRPSVDGQASVIAGLSLGDDRDAIDPWGEAVRRRQLGDRAGSAIWLFLALLHMLRQRGHLRWTAGQTARQLVLTISDPAIRRDLGLGLRAFEEAVYGHREPSAQTLDELWLRAERLRLRLAQRQVRS